MAIDSFLERCRRDRDDYRRYLEKIESSHLHIGDAAPGGSIPKHTSDYADHLRQLIEMMDAVIADIEVGNA